MYVRKTLISYNGTGFQMLAQMYHGQDGVKPESRSCQEADSDV